MIPDRSSPSRVRFAAFRALDRSGPIRNRTVYEGERGLEFRAGSGPKGIFRPYQRLEPQRWSGVTRRAVAEHRSRAAAIRGFRTINGLPNEASALRLISAFGESFPYRKTGLTDRVFPNPLKARPGPGGCRIVRLRKPVRSPFPSWQMIPDRSPSRVRFAAFRALDRSGPIRNRTVEGKGGWSFGPGRKESFGHTSALSRSGGAESPAGPIGAAQRLSGVLILGFSQGSFSTVVAPTTCSLLLVLTTCMCVRFMRRIRLGCVRFMRN